MSSSPTCATPQCRLASCALGAFVCFQLVNIPLSNYIKLVPVRFPEYHGEINGDLQIRLSDDAKPREPFQTVADATSTILNRWSEISGQGQCWALFTSFGTRAGFPIVELKWKDGREPVRLTCYFEPKDPTCYFYYPEPICRLWNYEYRMAVFHAIYGPESFKSKDSQEHEHVDIEKYRKESIDNVSDMRRSMRTYLQWKSHKFLKDHPEFPPPESVDLFVHVLPDPPPGTSHKDRPPSFEVPVARWYPSRPDDETFASLEAWDPIDKKYVRLTPGAVP